MTAGRCRDKVPAEEAVSNMRPEPRTAEAETAVTEPTEAEVDAALIVLAEERLADPDEEWLPWEQVEAELDAAEC